MAGTSKELAVAPVICSCENEEEEEDYIRIFNDVLESYDNLKIKKSFVRRLFSYLSKKRHKKHKKHKRKTEKPESDKHLRSASAPAAVILDEKGNFKRKKEHSKSKKDGKSKPKSPKLKHDVSLRTRPKLLEWDSSSPVGFFLKREIIPKELERYVRSKLEILCPSIRCDGQIRDVIQRIGIRLNQKNPTKLDKRRTSYKIVKAYEFLQGEMESNGTEVVSDVHIDLIEASRKYCDVQSYLFKLDISVLEAYKLEIDWEKGVLTQGKKGRHLLNNHMAHFIDKFLSLRYTLDPVSADIESETQEHLLNKIKMCTAAATLRLVSDGMQEKNLSDVKCYKNWVSNLWIIGSFAVYAVVMDYYHHKKYKKCAYKILEEQDY